MTVPKIPIQKTIVPPGVISNLVISSGSTRAAIARTPANALAMK